MTGNDLIKKIKKTGIGRKTISVNFTYRGNAAYIAEIEDVVVECTDNNIFIRIENLDSVLDGPAISVDQIKTKTK